MWNSPPKKQADTSATDASHYIWLRHLCAFGPVGSYAHNRYGVDTPKKGGASVSRHEFVMHRLAFGWSNPKTGRDFGRRPRQPAGNVLATRTSVPAPKTSADARRLRGCQGPSLVTQDTPIGNPGPFQAGGQAPPIHWVTVSQQGEFNGIPGQKLHTERVSAF